jgi:hypothetical protein
MDGFTTSPNISRGTGYFLLRAVVASILDGRSDRPKAAIIVA